MRAAVRVLMASAWLAVTVSGASAQMETAPGGSPAGDCGPHCRFFQGTYGPAATPDAPAEPARAEQTEEQPEVARPRSSRRGAASRKTKREAAAEEESASDEGTAERRSRPRTADKVRPKTNPRLHRAAPSAPVDVEQTASLPPRPSEFRFVVGADEAHRALAADLAAVVAPDLTVRTTAGRGMPLGDVLSLPGADVTVTSSLTF
jgi:hypothetical protein